MTTEWSELPNARLIDQVIADLNHHPDLFITDYVIWKAGWEAGWDAGWEAGWDAARDAAWNTGWRGAAWEAAWEEVWEAARMEARDVAWNAISALIAWDDAGEWLTWDADRLQVWVALSENPSALLLVPYVKIREQIKQSETV
jgi:hypothetical protein